MEPGEAQTFLGQFFKCRRLDAAAKSFRCTEADIVDQYDHNVGRTLGRLDLKPFGLGRIAGVHRGNDRGRWWLDRKHRAVHDKLICG